MNANEPTNKDRAEWARKTLQFFQELTGTDPEDAFADLTCDVGHLYDQDPDTWTGSGDIRVDFQRGMSHYADEVEDESTPSDAT